MPICGVPLILRRCSVHSSTPHSSGYRAPCIWAFLISLLEMSFQSWLIRCVKISKKGRDLNGLF